MYLSLSIKAGVATYDYRPVQGFPSLVDPGDFYSIEVKFSKLPIRATIINIDVY